MKIINADNLQNNQELVIFIITFNRLEILKKCISSLENLNDSFNLVIIDNGTNNKECLEFLNNLNYTIIRYDELYITAKNMDNMSAYNVLIYNINKSIDYYYSKYYSTYYAITDADISFENTNKNALSVYKYIIDKTDCNVGPELVISDIPNTYPLKMDIIVCTCHIFLPCYKEKYLKKINYKNEEIKYHHQPIDTTFQMLRYENNKKFEPCKKNIRVYDNYAAKHLDWYFDAVNITEDSLIYMNSVLPGSGVGGYGSSYLKEFINSIKNNNVCNYINELEKNFKNVPWDKSWSILYFYYNEGFYGKKDSEKANKILLRFIATKSKINSFGWLFGNDNSLVTKYLIDNYINL